MNQPSGLPRSPEYPSLHIPVEAPTGYRPQGPDDDPSRWGALELAGPWALGQRTIIVGSDGSGRSEAARWLTSCFMHTVPDLQVTVVLVDCPFDDTLEWRASCPGATVLASTVEDPPAQHVATATAIDHAREQADSGHDALVVIHSLSRLGRAMNVLAPDDDRVLTGGLLPGALQSLRRWFGHGRSYGPGKGSLTVVGTVSADGEQELDDVIHHELAGTANAELHLSRDLAQQGLRPAIDLERSGARHDELILGDEDAARRSSLRAALIRNGAAAGLDQLIAELAEHGSLAAVIDRHV